MGALDTLAAAVIASNGENKTAREMSGNWAMPSVTRDELADKAKRLAARIRDLAPESITPELSAAIATFPRRLQLIQAESIPQLWAGNAHHAVANYMSALDALVDSLRSVLGWQPLPNKDSWPPDIVKRTRSADSILKRIIPQIDQLDEKVQRINEAYAAAQDLPTVLADLDEARATVSKTSTSASELYGKIDLAYKEAALAAQMAADHKTEAGKLVQQCEIAYRITTTKGLAAAFDQRASRLSMSMWVWVFLLFVALGIAVYIGHDRLTTINVLLDDPKTEMSRIWMHGLLTLFGIAAPVWFAWLATKQIGQRFRLSEDYGFKAAVAKAYEGYRKEAARIDPALETRLFGSALTRLEEAPLRLVETESHGSPWHEFFSSETFRVALDKISGLRGKYEEAKMRTGKSAPESSEAAQSPPT